MFRDAGLCRRPVYGTDHYHFLFLMELYPIRRNSRLGFNEERKMRFMGEGGGVGMERSDKKEAHSWRVSVCRPTRGLSWAWSPCGISQGVKRGDEVAF